MKSPLAYIGGKSKLSKQIIPLIPDHETYCEVFAGAAWVFFGKEESKSEVLNDKDSDLISFYRVLQNHLEEFLRQFRWCLSSREWFEDWNDQIKGKGLTDIQRAARYYYTQRLAWGGRVRNRSYGKQLNGPPRINLMRLEEDLSQIWMRLSGVHIENLSWEQFIANYDHPDTFFYCDPPYYDCPDYQHNFKHNDFEALAACLGSIRGKFMLSINDHPVVRDIFKAFQYKEVSLLYTVAQNGPVKADELIYANYELKDYRERTLFSE